MKLNGIRVHRTGGTIFVPLPKESQSVIEGGCTCNYCKAHPELTPMWDTLAIATKARGSDHTWTVHYPELKG
jgi:hypothetical protein